MIPLDVPTTDELLALAEAELMGEQTEATWRAWHFLRRAREQLSREAALSKPSMPTVSPIER